MYVYMWDRATGVFGRRGFCYGVTLDVGNQVVDRRRLREAMRDGFGAGCYFDVAYEGWARVCIAKKCECEGKREGEKRVQIRINPS